MHKEERNVLKDERKTDRCTLDSREKTIAILGDSWWSRTAKEEGNKVNVDNF